MKRLAPFLCLMFVLSLSSCRCAWPPDVPTDDESEAAIEMSVEDRQPVS